MGYVEKTQWEWQERDVVELLLVRAVEENDPFPTEVLSEAAREARDAGSAGELLDKRAAYLFRRLDKSKQAWARLAFLPENSLGFVMLGAFLVGALSNYLGPSGVVHVAYNPLAFLIVWNIGVYTLLGWRRLAHRRSATHSDRPFQASCPTSTASQHPSMAEDTDVRHLAASGDDHFWLLPGFIIKICSIWDTIRLTWYEWMDQLRKEASKIKNTGKIAATFSNYYWHAARPVVIARVESLIHVGAIGLFLGAMVGTYVRGLFFEYNAVWRSTFLTDPRSVAAFLNVLLGPACLLINGTLLTPEAVQPLLSPQGTIAATWIHQLALMGRSRDLVSTSYPCRSRCTARENFGRSNRN